MKIWILLGLYTALLQGDSLSQLIHKVCQNNLDLAQIRDTITMQEERSSVANTWDNPYLSIGANDMLLEDIATRDREPMQTQQVQLTQTIPLRNKKQYARDMSRIQENILKMHYLDKLNHILSKVHHYAYAVACIDKKLSLISQYKTNVEHLTHLHQKRFEIGLDTQSNIERSRILGQKLTIKAQTLRTRKASLMRRIEKETFVPVENIEVSLNMDKYIDANLSLMPVIKKSHYKIQQAQASLDLARAQKIPDIKVGVGYFQRESRGDFLSINVGMPLPVYGKEEAAVKIAKQQQSRIITADKSLRFLLKREYQDYQQMMHDALVNHHTIQSQILPKQRYIQKLLQQEVFSKHTSLTELLENLNDSILLELEDWDEIKRYFDAYSDLIYFQGVSL